MPGLSLTSPKGILNRVHSTEDRRDKMVVTGVVLTHLALPVTTHTVLPVRVEAVNIEEPVVKSAARHP